MFLFLGHIFAFNFQILIIKLLFVVFSFILEVVFQFEKEENDNRLFSN